MASKHHSVSKSSEIPYLPLTFELHSAYRSPQQTKSLTTLAKAHGKEPKSHSKRQGLKSLSKLVTAIRGDAGKSMSISGKDPIFDCDSSKEVSALRTRDDATKTSRESLTQRKPLLAKPEKRIPTLNLTHSHSEFLHKEQFESSVIQLELKLTEQLKAANKASTSGSAFDVQFEIYSHIFQEVIDRDKHFGSLLAKVKQFYETWLRAFSKQETSQKVYEQCAEQLQNARRKLQVCAHEKKLMLRRIGALSKETVEMGRDLQVLEVDNERLRKTAADVRNRDIDNVAKDEQTWKALIVDNSNYQKEIHRLHQRLKDASLQSETLQCLVLRMKDRGFPIEELEDTPPPFPDSSKSDLEAPITSGTPKLMVKPSNIPTLQLQTLPTSDQDLSSTRGRASRHDANTFEEDFRAFLANEANQARISEFL